MMFCGWQKLKCKSEISLTNYFSLNSRVVFDENLQVHQLNIKWNAVYIIKWTWHLI